MGENTQFNVYLIGQLTTTASWRADGFTPYALFNTHESFDTEYLAEEWINQEGEKGQNYTILKIIKA